MMGTHKKSKKSRNRSRSRSRDSDRSEGYRSSKSKRSRRRKSSSRSRSSSSDRHRSPSHSPERRRKKKSKRSRSRSRDRYSEKRGRSRSRSREYKGSRRSRSRSSSRSKRKRRSRSRSHSKLSSRSKETSQAASPLPVRDAPPKDSNTTTEETPLVSLQDKMQKALEAAANADAQLREQGILTSMTRNEILTQKDEKALQKKLAAIEKDSFHSQPFQSSATSTKANSTQQPTYGISRDLNHDSAIFSSTNNTSDLENVARYLDKVQPSRNGKLASDLLSASKEEKEERWFLKLKAMRKQRLEGKPLPGQQKVGTG